jgi:multidrug resistance efflux pump
MIMKYRKLYQRERISNNAVKIVVVIGLIIIAIWAMNNNIDSTLLATVVGILAYIAGKTNFKK